MPRRGIRRRSRALATSATRTLRASIGGAERRVEGEPGDPAGLPQIDALAIDAGHPPAAARQPQQLAGIELDGVGMVLVHMGHDPRLALDQAGERRDGQQLGRTQPADLAEAAHQMGALDGHPIEVEILEAGIHPGIRMAGEKAAAEALVVGPLAARPSRVTRGPVSGWSRPSVPSNSSETRPSAAMALLCSARSLNSRIGDRS